jgi:hypothetical protein
MIWNLFCNLSYKYSFPPLNVTFLIASVKNLGVEKDHSWMRKTIWSLLFIKKKLNRWDVIGKSLRGLQLSHVKIVAFNVVPCLIQSLAFRAIAVWLLFVNNKKWIAFGILREEIDFTASMSLPDQLSIFFLYTFVA